MPYLVIIWSIFCAGIGIYAFNISLNNTFDKNFYVLLVCLYIIGLLVYFCSIKIIKYINNIPQIPQTNISISPIHTKDIVFLSIVALFCAMIGVFTFWLGFPGFINVGDIIYSPIILNKNGLHPVIMAYFLEFCYMLFGKHTYYLFLLNLIAFYIGIWFFVAGFYLKFRSFWTLLLFFPTFIGNIYLGNFTSLSYVGLYNLLFCAFAMILFLLLVPYFRYKKIIIYVIGILLFLAILWRHNAIFSVFPISFLLVYLLLKDRKVRFANYIAGIGFCAIFCVIIVVFIPKILIRGEIQPANHIFIHQIAGACVPADDKSCFKESWYVTNDEWSQIKQIYNNNLVFADVFNGVLIIDSGLFNYWIKAILKYPSNYLTHQSRFFYELWFGNPNDDVVDDTSNIVRSVVKSPQNLQRSLYDIDVALAEFPLDERKITFTPKRLAIYSFLYKNLIVFNHIIGVIIGALILIASSILLFKRCRNALLIFSFSVSFATIGSAIFITAFSPVAYSRYFAPILPLSIVALIGFVAFMCDTIERFE